MLSGGRAAQARPARNGEGTDDMPIYEYHCDDCGAEFETLVFTAQDIVNVACESCGSGSVTKLMSGAAVGHGGAAGGECGGGACDYNPRSHSCGGGCGCGG